MNRKRTGLNSVMSTGKEFFAGKIGPVATTLNTVRFKGKLGAAIAVITSLMVGFLTIPNNILYFIDDARKTRQSATAAATTTTQSPNVQDVSAIKYAYIHAGIAIVILGCLAMVVSIVLSYFAAKSKRKTDSNESSSTRTVLTCLIMMNVELFMAIIAGCMELLYRPLTTDVNRLHTLECVIAVFNIIIYVLYVISMTLTATILKGTHEISARQPVPEYADIVTGYHVSPHDQTNKGVNSYNTPTRYYM